MESRSQQSSLGNLLPQVLGTVNKRNSAKNPSFEHFVKWDAVGDERTRDHTDGVFYLEERGVRTLIVYVDSPVWTSEFTMDKSLFLSRIEMKFGSSWIDDLRFKVSSRVSENKKRERLLQKQQEDEGVNLANVPLSAQEQAEITQQVEVLEDTELQDSVRSALEAYTKWKKSERNG